MWGRPRLAPVPLLPCPSCRGDQLLEATGNCTRCRGEWISAAHTEAKAPGRMGLLRKHVSRGPPTERSCSACRTALKAFDIPGHQYEGDLFWGKEMARTETHCIGEGCPSCGGVWVEADQLARGGGRTSVGENLGRLADSLA